MPQSIIAYRLMAKNPPASATIHTAQFVSARRCPRPTSPAVLRSASPLTSPSHSATEGSPSDCGESRINTAMSATPMKPNSAAPQKPLRHARSVPHASPTLTIMTLVTT